MMTQRKSFGEPSRVPIQNVDKWSRPYFRLYLEGSKLWNTFFEHRRNCGCTRCNAARSRYEAIGTLVQILEFSYDSPGFKQEWIWNGLDAIAELLKKRYSN